MPRPAPPLDPAVEAALALQAAADAAVTAAAAIADPGDKARAELAAARDAYQAALVTIEAARAVAIRTINEAFTPSLDGTFDVPLSEVTHAVRDLINTVKTARTALTTHVAAHTALDSGDYAAARVALGASRPAYNAARAAQITGHA